MLERSRVSLYTIREPTLIFHLDKKKIKQIISWMLSDRFSIKDWCDHEACSYLTPEDLYDISELEYSSATQTFREGLHRGVGFDLSESNYAYTTLVEKLFQVCLYLYFINRYCNYFYNLLIFRLEN